MNLYYLLYLAARDTTLELHVCANILLRSHSNSSKINPIFYCTVWSPTQSGGRSSFVLNSNGHFYMVPLFEWPKDNGMILPNAFVYFCVPVFSVSLIYCVVMF